MSIYLGYDTAYRFWNLPIPRTSTLGAARLAGPCDEARTGAGDLDETLARNPRLAKLGMPLHIVVPHGCSFTHDRFQRHSCRYQSQNSYIRLTEDVYVATPELCFLQMARGLGLLKLVLAGCRLSAVQVPSANGGQDHEIVPAATSSRRISWYLDHFATKNAPGLDIARKAAGLVIDRTASHRESQVAMVFFLPSELGCFELEPAECGTEIKVDPELQRHTHQSSYYPDFYWPGHKLVLEYDSNAWHATRTGLNHDSERDAAYGAMGLTAISLTNGQLGNTHLLDTVYMRLCQKMGIMPLAPTEEFERARDEFRLQIFGRTRWDRDFED